MGDFDSCRFDFRIDTKSGLTPSRRKRAEKRNCNYSTLFKCKTCGSLFESRPALLDHKVLHNEFRCIVCDDMYQKKSQLDEHMMVAHGMFNKSPAKMAADGQNDDDDEIVLYPQSTSPAEIVEEDDDDEVTNDDKGHISGRAFASPPAGSAVKTSTKSPRSSFRKILPSPTLPPLVSVGATTGSSSPSLPSSSIISAAVRNVLSNIVEIPQTTSTAPNDSPAPRRDETLPEVPAPPRQPSPAKVDVPEQPSPMPVAPPAQAPPPPQTPTAPAMLSPQPMLFSPMAAFPQIRYAFPHQMMHPITPVTPEASGTTTPMVSTATPSSAALPPGYVYINVPMLINPAPGQASMPQLIPSVAGQASMPQLIPSIAGQASMPQPIPSMPMPAAIQTTQTVLPHDQVLNDTSKEAEQASVNHEPPKRKLDQADSTTAPLATKNKRKRTSPEKEPCLVIQDPRSLSSTDYEQNGIGPIKIEPESPGVTEALDFTNKQDPVRQDVNISQANAKEDNPLDTDVVDLCNSPDEEMDFEDDKAAMLDQYRDISLMDNTFPQSEEPGISKVDADSTSQASSSKEDRNTPKDYSCDQCEFKAANGAFLTQHKAKAHKAPVKSGLNKLLGKLWQNKMKQPESEPEEELKPIKSEPVVEPAKEVLQDSMPQFPGNPQVLNDSLPSAANLEVKSANQKESESSYGMFKFHTCKVCKQLFDNVNDMWEHMGSHKELRKFKCTLCNFKAVCRDRLVQHKQAEHPEYVKNPWAAPTRKGQQGNKAQPKGSSQMKEKAPESRGSHHGSAASLQCPEEGCTLTFRTLGGLKNHQFSHLEENYSNDGSNGPSSFTCPALRCSQSFSDLESLNSHLVSSHPHAQASSSRSFTCSLCKYKCRQRNSLNWHMKNKHGLEKAKTASGRTIYIDDAGSVVVNDTGDGRGVQPDGTENSLSSVPSPKEIQARVDEVMQHSMPDEHQRFVYNRIDGLATPGVISYTNEPEEITIEEAGPLTVDKLALHDRLKEEEKDEQPIDMSVKKEGDAASELSNNSSSLDLSLYSGEVIRTLGAVPSGSNTPFVISPCSTPVQEKKECTLEIDSISTPTEDMQHFTSVLKLKYVGGATGKEPKKRSPPQVAAAVSKFFNCQLCDAPFTDASKMWEHRLSAHADSVSIHCDTCPFSAPSKEDLQNHMLSTHGNELGNFKAFICFICGKGYGTKSGLNHHMLRHSEEGPPALPCPFPECKAKLHSKGSLKMHLRRQHGGNASNVEPTNTTSNASSTTHAKVVSCRFAGCGKTFSTTKHMKVHQMQHTGEMPLKCHLCEYACRQRNSMNWHMQSKHNLEKRVSDDGRHTYYV